MTIDIKLKVMATVKRLSVIVFVIITATGLIASVILTSQILMSTSVSNPSTSSSTMTFDQTTISQLNKLSTSNNNTNYSSLPSGRTNPFSE